MSDLCMYELEDIVWDDFCQCDDHIVPHPGDEQAKERSRKKPRREVNCLEIDAGGSSPAKPFSHENSEKTVYEQRNKMLEKAAWSPKSDGVFPSCESEPVKEVSGLASDGTKTSYQSELCANSSVLNDKTAAVANTFSYPLEPISETNNDLCFFGDNHEYKDSNDLLYYGWADIGNFEDVDRMFRSCDSTYGLGTSHEDDLGWFSSSDAIGGSEDVLKSDFKFSSPESSALRNISAIHDTSRLNSSNSSIRETNMQNASGLLKGDYWPSADDESAGLDHLSFSNGSGGSGGKKEVIPKGQVNELKEQLKHQNQSEISRNDQYLENNSFMYVDNMPESLQQKKQVLDSDSFGYVQSDVPFMSTDHSCRSDQTSLNPSLSAVKSENSSLTALSQKDFYASNQVQCVEGSPHLSFQRTSIAASKKREKVHHQQGFEISFDNNSKNVDLAVQASTSSKTPMDKPFHYSGNNFKNHTDTGGVNMGIVGESGSSVAEESSTNSGLDDISVEATSFRQLQVVMERLDLRTKLCIRDSLYRLARSAEQRHNYVKFNGGSTDDRDSSGVLLGEGRNKYTDFMDMETDTNPIDRSIAHLLFHRPADSSVMPGRDSLSYNSSTPIHGSISSSPVVAEDLVKREETAPETNRK